MNNNTDTTVNVNGTNTGKGKGKGRTEGSSSYVLVNVQDLASLLNEKGVAEVPVARKFLEAVDPKGSVATKPFSPTTKTYSAFKPVTVKSVDLTVKDSQPSDLEPTATEVVTV